jgi:hypothetical protein
MSERDVMALLAAANPVRVGDLSPTETPDLSGRRRPSRRAVLALAAVGVVAASLLGVFVWPGSRSHVHTTPMLEPGLGIGGPTLPPPPRSIPAADISLMLGVPVALPSASTVQPADASSVTAGTECPTVTPEIDGTCVVTVKFPSDSLSVEFWRPSGAPFQNQLAGAVRQEKEEAARHPGSGRVELLDLNGVPARYLSGDYSIGPEGTGSIDFLVGPHVRVLVYGHQSEAELEAAAQSIRDRTPFPEQVTLADASSALGAPVVLPDTEAVHPADAAPTAETACLAEPSEAVPCQVTVEFPTLAKYYVPLTIRYLRPAQADPAALYENIAKQVKGAEIVSLNGVSALFVPGSNLTYPSWIEFVGGGTDVTIQGIDDKAVLVSMAQSILDRTSSQ